MQEFLLQSFSLNKE